MGWDGSYSYESAKDVQQDVLRNLQPTATYPGWKVLGTASKAFGRRFYVAAESLKTGEKVVFLTLIEKHGARGDRMWMKKDMDESCGPYDYDCPVKLLDLTENPGQVRGEYATAWRAKVRELAAEMKAAIKNGPKFKAGDMIQNGIGEQYEVVGPYKTGIRVIKQANGMHYKVTRNSMPRYTKVEPEPVEQSLTVEEEFPGGEFENQYADRRQTFADMQAEDIESGRPTGI